MLLKFFTRFPNSVTSLSQRKNLFGLTLGRRAFSQLNQANIPKRLPVGYESFHEVKKKNLNFADKSLFIQDVLDDETIKTIVITRPPCFGKSFNLSMLHCFLSNQLSGEAAGLFENLKIASLGDAYMCHQGRYPVISINFNMIGQKKIEEAYEKLHELIISTYEQHCYLVESDKLSKKQKQLYETILEGKATRLQLENSLKNLTECLYSHHGVKPWLLIDDYDAPIQIGYVNNYYEEIVEVMSKLIGTALKSNPALEKAVIMGVFRITKESLFFNTNNIAVYSLSSEQYSQHFGFDEEEVNKLLKSAHLQQSKSEAIRSWYRGYQVGYVMLYNPLSIAACIKREGAIEPYWVNTGSHQLIEDIIKKAPLSFKKEFALLLQGKSIEKFICEDKLFQHLNQNFSSVWTLLLMSGYLKLTACQHTEQGTLAKLAIPNKEVRSLYRNIIEQWLSNEHGAQWYNEFMDELLSGNILECKKYLDQIILQVAKFHNEKEQPEAFYYGLLLGLTASLQPDGLYAIDSFREGNQRFCITLVSKCHKPNVILELKVADEKEPLILASEDALNHINGNRSFEKMNSKETVKVGIGFRGKYLMLSDQAKAMENQSAVESIRPH